MQKDFVILTNDPSITAWGWAVVTVSGKIIGTGCIKTCPDNSKKNLRKSDDRIRRVSEINKELLALIDKHTVQYILSEAPHGSQSAVAAVMIGMVAGMVQTISDCTGIPVEYYAEGEVKKCILNKRSAVKDEMIQAMKQSGFVPTGIKFRDEAVADALAVFHTALQKSEAIRLMKKVALL